MSDVPENVLKRREYSKIYRERNKEKERERQRKVKERKRNSDREAYNAYMREWTAKNRDRLNAERRERRKNDPEYAERVRSLDRARPASQVKNSRLRSTYGIDLEQFNKMLLDQDNKCAICGSSVGDSIGRSLSVDHCHKTGAVRGLLCTECNTGLGKFKDSEQLLLKAIEYLKG